jgi:hypothetical protein
MCCASTSLLHCWRSMLFIAHGRGVGGRRISGDFQCRSLRDASHSRQIVRITEWVDPGDALLRSESQTLERIGTHCRWLTRRYCAQTDVGCLDVVR